MSAFLSRVCGDLTELNRVHRDNLAGLIGISVTAVGPDFVCGTMPVDERTRQPFGLLHGGASVVLAETLGSVASHLLVAGQGGRVAGIEVNASHLQAVREGVVTGCCRPLRLGRSLHFWSIAIRNESGDRCCEVRLTVSVQRAGG